MGEPLSQPRRFYYGLQFTVRGVWDDNIFLTHTNKTSDYYFAIEPQLTLGFGDIQGRSRSYLRLDYMPSAILFVDHSDEDAFNQLIRLEGGYNSGRLRLSLEQDVVLLESANLNSFIDTTGLWANTDASAPTAMNIFYTRLRAQYDLTVVTTPFRAAFTFIISGCQRYRWVLAARLGITGWMIPLRTNRLSR